MTDSQIPDTASVSAALADVLFAGHWGTTHERWRKLFSSARFHFHEGLTHRERIALSYDRLRLVNEAVGDPQVLANDPVELTAIHEWAGAVDPGMATIVSIHYNLFFGSLVDHEAAGRDLGEYVRADRIGTFLCTEVAHGNDAAHMETTATYDRVAGGFVLNTPHAGAQKFMPNTSPAGGAKGAVVAARLIVDGTDHGVFLFLTPLSDSDGSALPGVEVRPLPQTASSPVDHCATTFHQARVPFSALLQGDHGRLTPDGEFTSTLGSPRRRFLQSIGRVTMGKLCMTAHSLGVMRHALDVAMRYAHTRVTSGMTNGQRVPLIAHRGHHTPLLDAVATTYAATLLQRSVVRQWDRATGEDREAYERLTAISKAWITWRARAVMTECRERCGAQGLIQANGIALQLASIEGTITAEGDNAVIMQKAGGEMLLGGIDLKPESELAAEDRKLTDPQFLQDLLADIERISHSRAKARLRQRAASPLARWNATVTPAVALADAHVHRLAGESLLTAADQVPSGLSADLLRGLHALFTLRRVAAHSGDLLARSRLTAHQVEHLPDAIEAVLGFLEPHGLTLTRAFGVSESLLETHPILSA
ncbi:acyl-CoA oxidase [Streptomyces sp. CB00316]|uniref:acyl-CoA dehydrogenase family protein n=1 Tax=unclassified Streptomyces TaxID=2593676 RepID=UPI000939090C|nr:MULTISPECIES: acyl-CoA dehydrogenase [unclassified Streptomyces]MBT2375928.1 acyl-CoA oxidase [Streptomyces sp. ISL-111]MBT2428177.1 acyl-CoA oxidase [Streptomyces sp. ISL-112]MBT2463028.1 acyl-CoA oxidase [Streptomyces sp. ISL-63]OKJ18279.1 acyl-CoA oxidase [Streptomyces sp. CB00316]